MTSLVHNDVNCLSTFRFYPSHGYVRGMGNYNKSIMSECAERIEKSVPRIAVWHHEACRVMTNGDPEGRNFLSYPHTNNGLFFLLTTVFIYFSIYSSILK